MYDPETSAKIQLYRQKSLDGTLTQDEMREAIGLLRQGRAAAAATSAKSRSKKAPVDSGALLDQLDSL